MRYQVGQTIPFIHVFFSKKESEDGGFISLFHPKYHHLDRIDVKMLEVKEHHKVAWDQDPTEDKRYDGFVMTERRVS